jgi:Fur family peroxide stress response transcriptional regulator
MSSPLDPSAKSDSTGSPLRMTRQRSEIYNVLKKSHDHPTANEVFMRVRENLPNVSLATVYNCLETLVEHEMVKQVNFDREPSRFCPNLAEHGHFHDKDSGQIHDVLLRRGVSLNDILDLPPGAIVDDFEITIRGRVKPEKASQQPDYSI